MSQFDTSLDAGAEDEAEVRAVSPLYLPYISPISPLYLPYISPRTRRRCAAPTLDPGP